MTAPLYGLVLAGGRSTRMGEDKAALRYAGCTQLERAMALLTPLVARAYVSVRRDQTADPVRARFAQIEDALEEVGPIAGILAAQARHPEAAWLVLACDLPFLDALTLAHLIAARDAAGIATAYRSQPRRPARSRCARSTSRAAARCSSATSRTAGTARAASCAASRRACWRSPTRGRSTTSTRARNMPQRSGTLQPQEPMTVRTLTVAVLRAAARAGRAARGTAADARRARRGSCTRSSRGAIRSRCRRELLRVAINAEFADWAQPLAEGDAVVFLPPVAGG